MKRGGHDIGFGLSQGSELCQYIKCSPFVGTPINIYEPTKGLLLRQEKTQSSFHNFEYQNLQHKKMAYFDRNYIRPESCIHLLPNQGFQSWIFLEPQLL